MALYASFDNQLPSLEPTMRIMFTRDFPNGDIELFEKALANNRTKADVSGRAKQPYAMRRLEAEENTWRYFWPAIEIPARREVSTANTITTSQQAYGQICTPTDLSIGLFVMNVVSDDAAKKLFKTDDWAKVIKIEPRGPMNKAVYFGTVEERDSIFEQLPAGLKSNMDHMLTRQPLVKIFEPRPKRYTRESGRRGGRYVGPGRGFRRGHGDVRSQFNGRADLRRGGRQPDENLNNLDNAVVFDRNLSSTITIHTTAPNAASNASNHESSIIKSHVTDLTDPSHPTLVTMICLNCGLAGHVEVGCRYLITLKQRVDCPRYLVCKTFGHNAFAFGSKDGCVQCMAQRKSVKPELTPSMDVFSGGEVGAMAEVGVGVGEAGVDGAGVDETGTPGGWEGDNLISFA